MAPAIPSTGGGARRPPRSHPARLAALALVLSGVASACATTGGWEAGTSVLSDARSVALALGDPPPHRRIVLADLPELAPPHHARMCCALGMDLEVDFAGLHVPFFEVSNIIASDELGAHAYEVPAGATDPEGNGLLYTCRGGWIDTAHARENADTVLFLALRMAATLATGTTIEIPGHGGATTITVAPVPASLIARDGALTVAGVLAAWTTNRLSVWHEISTFYGYEMVAGFSERPSAFSPEDLYSDALGIRIALAILDERAFGTDDAYDLAVAAYLEEALVRLEVLDRDASRAVMEALDGRWWDSGRRLPDNLLVLRRAFPIDSDGVRPWRAEEAFASGDVPEVLVRECGGAHTRALALPTTLGHAAIDEIVSISWAPEAWATETLPLTDPARAVVVEGDLERLVADVRAGLERELGEGFDRPGPRPSAP